MGDFDSAPQHIKNIYEKDHIIKLNREKDYTDTHVAVIEALKRKPETVILVGTTGGRLDHMLANINLLSICTKEKVKGFKYKLTDKTLVRNETIGISNEIEREEGFITLESGELMVIESKD